MKIELITGGSVSRVTSSRDTIEGLTYRVVRMPLMTHTNDVETWLGNRLGYKKTLLYFRIEECVRMNLFMGTLTPKGV